MSKDDSNSGFLSKVVKFVRHPTTSWWDLDAQVVDRENEYSKAALKEMIERKRRSDFVRKREFDMLRKIRSREASGEGGQGARPSFFQSSLPSKPDDRALTLKKIDEIEAQMSMQWWKTKSADSQVSTISGLDASVRSTGGMPLNRKEGEAKNAVPDPEAQRRKDQYKPTEAMPLAAVRGISPQPQTAQSGSRPVPVPPHQARSSQTPQPPTAPAPAAAHGGLMAPTAPAELSDAHSVFPASHFYALDVQEIALDPDVEEASIRFASGDDAGAEQGLLEALGGDGERQNHLDAWLALFDLYRATGQLTPFESRAVDFVNRFGRSAPQWYDLPSLVAAMNGKVYTASTTPNRAVWACEPDVDAHAVGTLQNLLLRAHQPWVLDWTPIKTIDVKAVPALLGVFTLWGDQDIELRFLGESDLRDLLKRITPSGRRDIDQIWWKLRMAVLRVMNRPDEFELTALDFCVTYEVSPPGWEKPLCHFQGLSGGQSGDGGSVSVEMMLEQLPSGDVNDSSIEGQNSEFNNLGLVELSGEIQGDPQATLDVLEGRLQGVDVMIISCRNLIRVDFSAAGALLNWVAGHHPDGRVIQFVDTHRLVSAFFHVIGITEYAKVVVRND